MVERKTILFEMSFWESFSERYSHLMQNLDKDSLEDIRTWVNIFSFISRSNTIWDCSGEHFNIRFSYDPYLAMLWKRSTNGECGIEFNNHSFSDIDSFLKQYPSAVYLSAQDQSSTTSKYGVMNINLKNYNIKKYLFLDSGSAIQKGQEWDWTNLRDTISEASNSMIIVDNYVFNREQYNLYRLLDIILPQHLEIPYHINCFYINGTQASIDNLKQFICNIRPHLDIKYDFVQTVNTDFHDRAIITNNIWIGSGAGFDLLRPQHLHCIACKSTTISVVYPFFSSDTIKWVDRANQILISDAKMSLKIRQREPINRLLEG